MPIFFFSDPPHLIKKLRNNLYTSGHKSEHPRYIRSLFLRDKYILWDHVYSVYKQEMQRHLYVTDMRKAHVTIDSVSKMCVKLADDTLSLKVAKEMEACDRKTTEETRTYITMCQTFWSIFNDPIPLKTVDDARISKLGGMVQYFYDWESWLSQKYETKAEQAQHYISWQTKFDLQVRMCFTSVLVILLYT